MTNLISSLLEDLVGLATGISGRAEDFHLSKSFVILKKRAISKNLWLEVGTELYNLVIYLSKQENGNLTV